MVILCVEALFYSIKRLELFLLRSFNEYRSMSSTINVCILKHIKHSHGHSQFTYIIDEASHAYQYMHKRLFYSTKRSRSKHQKLLRANRERAL